jgi:hypothetical protein
MEQTVVRRETGLLLAYRIGRQHDDGDGGEQQRRANQARFSRLFASSRGGNAAVA